MIGSKGYVRRFHVDEIAAAVAQAYSTIGPRAGSGPSEHFYGPQDCR